MSQPKPLSLESLESRQLLAAAPWGAQAKLIGQDLLAARFPNLTGAGQTVAVIDTGVAYTHPSLGGGWGKKVIAGWDFVQNDSTPFSDTNAHGTGVAGMIASSPYDYKGQHYQGIAPGVKIIALREQNSYGVDAALKWVIANKAKYNIVAVNMTDFGGGSNATYQSIRNSLGKLTSMNVYITAPAGNGGASRPLGARDPREMVVGSTNKSGAISGFSQRGPALDFLAPGEKVTLPYYDTRSRKAIYVDTADGTSWAAPQVAGAAALIRQVNPRFTNDQVTAILRDSSVKTYDGVSRATYARLNLYGAVVLAYQRSVNPNAGYTPYTPPPSGNTGAPAQPAGTQFSTPTTVTANTTIQAEDFDAGSRGQAWWDTDTASTGGNAYRSNTGVDIVSANDSGSTRSIGMVRSGEWVKYTVNVQATGTYTFDFRVSALGGGGQFYLEVDGKNATGTLSIPDTRSWNSYTTVSKAGVNLTAGKHTLRLVFSKAGRTGYVGNFNSIRLTKTGVARSTPQETTRPFGTLLNVAAGKSTTIQAENYDIGPAGLAYRDATAANEGRQYRSEGVDIEKTLDVGGGFDVAYLKAGEWMNYTINVTKAGTFNLDARVASIASGAKFRIEVDGKNVTGSMQFANTGSFQKWTTLRKGGIALSAGKHTLKLVVESTGNQKFAGNVNWIKLG